MERMHALQQTQLFNTRAYEGKQLAPWTREKNQSLPPGPRIVQPEQEEHEEGDDTLPVEQQQGHAVRKQDYEPALILRGAEPLRTHVLDWKDRAARIRYEGKPKKRRGRSTCKVFLQSQTAFNKRHQKWVRESSLINAVRSNPRAPVAPIITSQQRKRRASELFK